MENNWTSEQVLRYVDPIQKENEELKQQIATYQDKDKEESKQEEYKGPSIMEMAEEANIRKK